MLGFKVLVFIVFSCDSLKELKKGKILFIFENVKGIKEKLICTFFFNPALSLMTAMVLELR